MPQDTDRYTSSSTKVFSIPELVSLINSYTDTPGDTVRLAQVCRDTFQALIPLIWQAICGVEHLLGLIASTSFRHDESTGELQEVVLNKRLDEENQFKRFDIYAPFVRFLRVYSHGRPSVKISGWSILTSRAQTSPLLPNLTVLIIQSENLPARGVETPLWISAFGTTTVRTVSMIPCDHYWLGDEDSDFSITPASASTIMEALVDRCPELEEVAICPISHSSNSGTMGSESLTGPKSAKHWYEYLRNLPKLEHASVASGKSGISYQTLLALGQLPCLSSLVFHLDRCEGLGFDFSYDSHPDLPSGAFPALRRLSFQGVETDIEILDIFRFRGLLGAVTHLNLTHSLERETNEDGSERMTHELLPLLANAPNLQHLVITDNYCLPPTNRYYLRLIGIPKVLDVMAQLPLVAIHLEKMHLGTGALNLNLDIIWPNVTVLWMPSQHASLQELSYFAALPKLRRLSVRLDMTTTHTPQNIPRSNHAPLYSFDSAEGTKLPQDFEVMTHNIRVLHQLWPCASTVTWCDQDMRQRIFSNLAKSFNCLLSAHRNISLFREEGDGGRYDDVISQMEWMCEDLRKKVDRGVDPAVDLKDSDSSECCDSCCDSSECSDSSD